jgi:ABC-2 type transport system ATP-binding protein
VTTCIEAAGLTKRFGTKAAVQGLDLHVGAGEIYGLLGPNGAGKTTTLKMLAGLLHPTAGRAAIGGIDIQDRPEEAKRHMGFIPDSPFIYETLTGREFLVLVANLYGVDHGQLRPRVESLVERFQAGDWIDQRAESYSHGMRQKLVLASALLHQPRAYLIDEPMVGLDPASIMVVRNTFKEEAARGASLLLSTHTLSLAESFCHRIGIISRGRLVAEGTMDELRRLSPRRHADLESLYLEFTQPRDV